MKQKSAILTPCAPWSPAARQAIVWRAVITLSVVLLAVVLPSAMSEAAASRGIVSAGLVHRVAAEAGRACRAALEASVRNELPSRAVAPVLITHGPRDRREVALTFDACETPGKRAGYDARIVRILAASRTPATLFLGGLWMRSHPAVTRELAGNNLFELGSHSWSHPDLTKISNSRISAEVLMTQREMLRLTGRQARVFRPPFGFYDERVLRMVAARGLRVIQWDVVTGDPDPNVSADDIVGAVRGGARDGSIIIMHMNGRGWHTAEALPGVIRVLRQKGLRPVTASRLLSR